MFTISAMLLVGLIAWAVNRQNERDRSTYDLSNFEDREQLLILHSRQDLKLIAFLLVGVIVMLGVIADRIG